MARKNKSKITKSLEKSNKKTAYDKKTGPTMKKINSKKELYYDSEKVAYDYFKKLGDVYKLRGYGCDFLVKGVNNNYLVEVKNTPRVGLAGLQILKAEKELNIKKLKKVLFINKGSTIKQYTIDLLSYFEIETIMNYKKLSTTDKKYSPQKNIYYPI